MTGQTAGVLCLALVLPMLALVALNVLAWPAITRRRASSAAAVSVLIPARDESSTIVACLESVVAQGPTVGEILVYDDRSSDDTAEKVRRFARQDARVRLLPGGDLPPGWCGKPHACQRLAEAATGEWLLFLDADARLLPHASARLLEETRARGVTMLSAWPGLRLESVWERLLMPVLNLVVFSLYPAPLALVRRDPSLGLAHGACIVAHRETYLALGGHGLVCDQLFEDSRLAQAWRARGERGLCLDGQSVVTVRMYSTGREIWRGFQKNFYPAFHRDVSFWLFLTLHAAAFILPVVLLVVRPSAVILAAAAGGILMRLLLAARFRHPFWSAFLHPLATCVLIGIGLSSRASYRARRGVEWKGRRYRAHGEVA